MQIKLPLRRAIKAGLPFWLWVIQEAVVGTGIIVVTISVITGFIALLPVLKVEAPHTIPARGNRAIIKATVGRDAVAIITGFEALIVDF